MAVLFFVEKMRDGPQGIPSGGIMRKMTSIMPDL